MSCDRIIEWNDVKIAQVGTAPMAAQCLARQAARRQARRK
ncbi:hypothetical protein PATSB16_27460 [Pandoraea thiooxydans]|nr:hypothetical protein PATSB16_27460 [Pandoraea thiooxydans]